MSAYWMNVDESTGIETEPEFEFWEYEYDAGVKAV